MANYGFAIDLRKCIGCHACSVACKAEHEVPLGVARVLVGDLAAGDYLVVHLPSHADGPPPAEILERLLEGLRGR